MPLTRPLARTAAALAAGAALTASALAAAPAASAAPDRSLAALLTSDGDRFDRDGHDFDVLTEAVLAVLEAKPDSPVGVLADDSVRLTAFLPDDQAFKALVRDLGGRAGTEERTFESVAALGIDTVEQVLLYHVVPGATIRGRQALQADGATLETALPGATLGVRVPYRGVDLVRLVDADPTDRDAWVVDPDVAPRGRQAAHAISLVLRPADL
ncbi:fasciclin domain-containing protein [Vallicoccus soli]|uniref:Fasciclin domain-containing protein n=1 Tax=Vallicoccus soli TaxID=2339232 RepID=A0A3A3YWN1_9ACTN|nr:fasciclin domain-containing protein [Vallicoccus soli]RJK96018.1 fasciclin domain-containing protein [Vallicoccus soli]